MLYEIFCIRWVTTSLNFYFLDKKLCICVFLFSFTAAKKMGQRQPEYCTVNCQNTAQLTAHKNAQKNAQ